MEDWQRSYIVQNKQSLAINTKCNNEFIKILIQNEVLRHKDAKLLAQFEDEHAKSLELYEILMSKREAYRMLMRALGRTGQSEAFTMLLDGLRDQ
ncbi:unnamed protein product [Orchesella dallaii]|uniref:CARD domain-containing protein n=1 Tax=Orchesella dallaii TaxID=48710 RepID=A0ABP1QC76_9HEXA